MHSVAQVAETPPVQPHAIPCRRSQRRYEDILNKVLYSMLYAGLSTSPFSARSSLRVTLFALAVQSSSRAFSPAAIFTRRASLGKDLVHLHNSRPMSTLHGTRTPEMAMPKFSVAACQLLCGEDKAINILSAEKAVKDAAAAGAHVVVLPECWNSPYDTASFPVYAEPVPDVGEGPPSQDDSPSVAMLCRTAADNKVYLIGGSVPESGKDGAFYNTCVIVGPEGIILAKHRKVHLFDIDIPGEITFMESRILKEGETITTVETPYGKIGVGICYDIRFPELSIAMRSAGAILLCFPGAFNMVTGPAHWELLQRSRAVDTQCYVVTASPARNPTSKYQAWGHSSIVDPWGKVVATSEHESTMVLAEVDPARIAEVRRNIPVAQQKRNDLYQLRMF